MRLTSSSRQSSGRRLVLALAAVVALTGLRASAWAQEAQQQAAPQQQVQTITFPTDAGIIGFAVKPDKAADFEKLIAKLREGLEKTDNPVRKQQAGGLKFFKLETGANLFYLFLADPAVKDADYTPLVALFEAFPDPAQKQEFYNAWKECISTGSFKWNLQALPGVPR